MSEFTIRGARDSELPAVGDLTLAAYRADGVLSGDTGYSRKLADATPRLHEAELLVAVADDGAVLGTVTVAPPGNPWQEVGVPGTLEFRMLAVSPAARGKGVGEALTRRVIDRAAELGLNAVVLSSSPLMTTAHRLYERLGFRRTPEHDWRPLPDLLLLTYRLDL